MHVIYPVDSPGGYQMTGRTIPIFDALGWKEGFSPSRPYLFQDFDLLTYYRVSEEELDVLLADFRSGRYKFEWEDIEFDMAEHNKLLTDTAKEVESIRAKQAIAQAEMTKAENESLTRWREEKAKNKVDDSTIESLLAGEYLEPLHHSCNLLTIQIPNTPLSIRPSLPTSGKSWWKKTRPSNRIRR
jgi:urea carboxylase